MLAVIPSATHGLSLATFVAHATQHPPLLAIYVACAVAAIEIVGTVLQRKAKRLRAAELPR